MKNAYSFIMVFGFAILWSISLASIQSAYFAQKFILD